MGGDDEQDITGADIRGILGILTVSPPGSRPRLEQVLSESSSDRHSKASLRRTDRVFARKVHSLALGILFGLAVGLALAFVIAYMQHGYYFQIMLPGGMVGLIVGYATQRYGGARQMQPAG